MRIFCDTNIILEVLEERQNYEYVARILSSGYNKNDFFISEGSVYTLTYLLDRRMRNLGIHEPDKTEKVKETLLKVLNFFHVVQAGGERIKSILRYSGFKDLEDGYQYGAAMNCNADILLTINIKDYICISRAAMNVLTPKEYVSIYLSNEDLQ